LPTPHLAPGEAERWLSLQLMMRDTVWNATRRDL